MCRPFTNAPIYAQISGTVQKWYVDIGAQVKAGDLLAQIDPRTYQAALDQAKGQLARDSATLANAKVDLAAIRRWRRRTRFRPSSSPPSKTAVNADSRHRRRRPGRGRRPPPSIWAIPASSRPLAASSPAARSMSAIW